MSHNSLPPGTCRELCLIFPSPWLQLPTNQRLQAIATIHPQCCCIQYIVTEGTVKCWHVTGQYSLESCRSSIRVQRLWAGFGVKPVFCGKTAEKQTLLSVHSGHFLVTNIECNQQVTNLHIQGYVVDQSGTLLSRRIMCVAPQPQGI